MVVTCNTNPATTANIGRRQLGASVTGRSHLGSYMTTNHLRFRTSTSIRIREVFSNSSQIPIQSSQKAQTRAAIFSTTMDLCCQLRGLVIHFGSSFFVTRPYRYFMALHHVLIVTAYSFETVGSHSVLTLPTGIPVRGLHHFVNEFVKLSFDLFWPLPAVFFDRNVATCVLGGRLWQSYRSRLKS